MFSTLVASFAVWDYARIQPLKICAKTMRLPSPESETGVGVANPLRLKRGRGKSAAPPKPLVKPSPPIGKNAIIAMGLWLLLWMGYNTSLAYVEKPNFPSDAMDLFHGVRAFFPILAGWIALVLIFSRSKRLFTWVMGPLGLVGLYSVVGIVSSVTQTYEPSDALYYGFNYLAIVLVLFAIVLVDHPLPDLMKVLKLTWVVGTIFTLSLLGAIPFLGLKASVSTDESSRVGMQMYNGQGAVMGMASTRNTGFARYAAISALVALAGTLRKGKPVYRIIWGAVLLTSVYALYIANGRTEIFSFVCGMMIILVAEKATRTVNILISIAAAVLLGIRGFYSAFFLYFTRKSGHVDLTMTGRTVTWDEGWNLFLKSPFVGFGFQADRYFLRQHMHNAFLHVLVQSGILGGGAILIALGIVWFYMIRYFFFRQPADKSLIPAEIPAVFLFVTISSITESTFAYFSAAWLLSAPILAYTMALDRHMRALKAKEIREKIQRHALARRASRIQGGPGGVPDISPLGTGGGL